MAPPRLEREFPFTFMIMSGIIRKDFIDEVGCQNTYCHVNKRSRAIITLSEILHFYTMHGKVDTYYCTVFFWEDVVLKM